MIKRNMNAHQRETPHSNEELEERQTGELFLMSSGYGNTKRTMAPLKSSDVL